MVVEIVLGVFGVIGTVIALISRYEKRKAIKTEFEKMQKERKSFVETSIIKINNEFEPVTIYKANNYEFKLNGYTVSLKTGESLIIPYSLPDAFEYLMISGWGFASKDGKHMGNLNSKEELGRFIFLNIDQEPIKELKIVQPSWGECKLNKSCRKCDNPECIKFLDTNPDPAYGGDPSIEEVREKGILGKIKSFYENIHTHWIDLNIYVWALKIPPDAKYIKIALKKQNLTHISLNIAEIQLATKEEYAGIKEALKEEIQSPTIKYDTEVKQLLEIYQKLRNKEKPSGGDNLWLWKFADEYIENDIYRASKLLKYALIIENDLKEWKKEKVEKLMEKLKEKVERENDVQSCVLLSHFYGFKVKFYPEQKEEYKKKEAVYIEKAGDMIEEIREENEARYKDELMNLQWRCYESATRKYDEVLDIKKELEIRVKLNQVFERITERHPFASPIIDNAFENFNKTTNILKNTGLLR
ncbi:MAG: hypothetical protein ANIMEMIM_00221 [Candidatus Argoarchaeum ethanivorans]|uniref:Uncharacterized protein n=1 Tax=Candidatus Argoarchaeum ethanivorans TaxID=2608793 RepID=A0A811T8G7_9EURY|nr:MAG: hypothetical protein ANIMEMIM_00221 [Candidatus Argoarchaeum ethanivorans]